jgi:formylglycine-generating enzyme required for sulfatase activity
MKIFQKQAGLKILILLLLAGNLAGQPLDAQPVVLNVRASQRAGTGMVDIYYDLASASNALTVSVSISTNSGAAFNAPAASLSGDLGSGITPTTGKHVVWNAGTDLAALYFPNVKVRVTANDQVAPSGMALIPAGSFTMGNCMNSSEGYSDELPLHTVYVSAFYMDKYDVTLALWQQVYNWATTHGYSFDYVGSGKAANHPVQTIDWYDCVKWCNARSAQAGLTPVYYTDAGLTQVYTNGERDAVYPNWGANGYRLPTEAEWEKAARGGLSGHRFPWGDTISWSQANYYADPLSAGGYAYDVNPTQGYNPTFNDGIYPYTSPVGYFAPNGYGLYDMAGNVWQWCWDWYDGSWYSNVGATQSDTRGPASSPYGYRVLRGGNWGGLAHYSRCAYRGYGGLNPNNACFNLGFRCVRGL